MGEGGREGGESYWQFRKLEAQKQGVSLYV